MLLEHLSNSLILDPVFIEVVSQTASRRYKQVRIEKKDLSIRYVNHPAKELKTLQRKIHEDFLSKLPVHPSATAYRKGANTRKNALLHRGAKYLLRLDFKDFFGSIKSKDIAKYLDKNAKLLHEKWSFDDTRLFLNLVCFNDALTIGSVTSPAIANAICYQLDCEINGICEAKNIIYSRYADDMFFSSQQAGVLREIPILVKKIIRELDCPRSLWLNLDKTVHSSRKHRMSITNLVITNDGSISIGRNKKREIRSLIHNWTSLTLEQKNYVTGYLSYCRSVEPELINKLCEKYGAKLIHEIQCNQSI